MAALRCQLNDAVCCSSGTTPLTRASSIEIVDRFVAERGGDAPKREADANLLAEAPAPRGLVTARARRRPADRARARSSSTRRRERSADEPVVDARRPSSASRDRRRRRRRRRGRRRCAETGPSGSILKLRLRARPRRRRLRPPATRGTRRTRSRLCALAIRPMRAYGTRSRCSGTSHANPPGAMACPKRTSICGTSGYGVSSCALCRKTSGMPRPSCR